MSSGIWISIVLCFLSGCGRKAALAPSDSSAKSPEATPASEAASAGDGPSSFTRSRPATAPTAVEATAAAPQTNEPLVGLVHESMTAQLKKFIEETGRMPKDFSEFIHAKMDSVPRAPEGLKFAIDEATQEVKLVRK